MAALERQGVLHWKTWALAALDCFISTTKCVPSRRPGNHELEVFFLPAI